ncbi:MAG: hypothetical protein ACK44W_01745, partial [Planctomycetota bacterium]
IQTRAFGVFARGAAEAVVAGPVLSALTLTLIAHFLNVSWGPVVPPGEAGRPTEGSKGIQSYYVISDGGPIPYRVRARMPSFAHIQMVPHISRGHLVSDLLSILGSIDFVLGEVDR